MSVADTVATTIESDIEESLDTSKAATKKTDYRWQCRRGMLELDILLNNFVDSLEADGTNINIEQLSAQQLTSKRLTTKEKQTFELLLSYPDQTLLDLLLGSAMSGDADISSIIKLIQSTSSS